MNNLPHTWEKEKKLLLFTLAATLFWGLLAHGYGIMDSNFSHDSLTEFNGIKIFNGQGFKLEVDGVVYDMGDFLAKLYNPINDFLAVYPAIKQYKGELKDATFLYAELPEKDGEQVKVETFAEAFGELYAPIVDANEDGIISDEEYPANTEQSSRFFCHDRFYYDIQSFVMPIILGEGDYRYAFNAHDIRAYEIALANGTAAFANHVISIGAAKAQLIAYYLGIIDAVIASMTSIPSIDCLLVSDSLIIIPSTTSLFCS